MLKLELKPTTTDLSINSILKATSSGTPLLKLEPNFYVLDMGFGAAVGQIRYMECYNT